MERLEAMLYTAPSPPVDLMIRTSGEKRLSDFLLWQSENAIIHFTTVLWPEFSLWHLLAAIFYFQVPPHEPPDYIVINLPKYAFLLPT